jgi:hypothetical protein
MRRCRAVIVLLCVVVMFAAAGEAHLAVAGDGGECPQPVSSNVANDAVPGELLVTFKDGVPADRAKEITVALGVSLLRAMVDGRVHHVRVPDGVSIEAITARYLAHPEVVGVEPNSIIRLR